jgi:hypothetical protein
MPFTCRIKSVVCPDFWPKAVPATLHAVMAWEPTVYRQHILSAHSRLLFSGVGSGTGAVAAYEAINGCWLMAGLETLMKLMVSQNTPFLPIYNAWKAIPRQMLPLDDDLARHQVEEIVAKVLFEPLARLPHYRRIVRLLKRCRRRCDCHYQ